MKEPDERQIIERADAMLRELDAVSNQLKKAGKQEAAFVVYTLRRIARLEILVADLSLNSGE